MSLLLKALKQAETTNAGRNTPSVDLELEPVAPPPSSQGREWVEPPGLLFGSSGLTPEPRRGKAFRLPQLSLVPLTALLAVIIAVGYGIYLYLALQAPAPSTQLAAFPRPAQQVSAQPVATPPLPGTAALPLPAPPVAAKPDKATILPATGQATPARTRRPTPEAVPAPTSEARAAAAGPLFHADNHANLLDSAYAAYQRGQLAEAEQLYTQAAARQRSTDALLGLAAIAASLNRESEAARLYREILERDPRNATAQAALLDLLGNTDSQATESRLKVLIDREPSPHLHQTLGNLYAEQKRWSDAQAAYFEAYRGAPDNADYAYNLAVSLDQLRQHAAALTYYEKALATGGVHRFDRAQAEARVRQLRPAP